LPTTRPIVIVVDDDPAVRNSLKFSLEIEGFLVCTYANGAELLNARDLPCCSCFVVDQRMAEMTGLDLIAKLRDRRIYAPAILITSRPNAVLSERASKAGVSIVEKPLLGNSLTDRIRDACARGGGAHC
jgi:FixJ family two-component response regulator